MWRAQRNIGKKDQFVSSIFSAAGNEYFLNTPHDNKHSLGLKILNGRRPLTVNTRSTTQPFPRENMVLFFRNHLNPLKYHFLYDGFQIPNDQRGHDELIIESIVEVLRHYTIMDEASVSITVKNEYDRLYNLPISRKLVAFDTTEYELVKQSGQRCPISNKKLIKIKDNIRYADYVIIKIFPDNLTAQEESVFSKHSPKPIDLESVDNLIAVSSETAFIYTESRQYEMFKKLIKSKQDIMKRQEIDIELEAFNIENEIEKGLAEVISALHEMSPLELSDLSYDALRIDEKIPETEHATLLTVKNFVLRYYNYINDFFGYLDNRKHGTSTKIAENIKYMSEQLQALNISADEIIDRLAQTILDKTSLQERYLNMSRIIVCYFIQHCEVLSNEVTG